MALLIRSARAVPTPATAASSPAGADLLVVGDREAVGLVPDALEEVVRRGPRRERHGVAPLGHEHFLGLQAHLAVLAEPPLLRERDHRDLQLAEIRERGARRAELSFPSVDDDEVRGRPGIVVPISSDPRSGGPLARATVLD